MKRTVLSYGGGLDSWVMLLLVLYGVFAKPDLVVFADVSDGAPDRDPEDPGEWPSTYRHIREVAMPLCEELGIEFVWLTTAESRINPTKENPDGYRSVYEYFVEKKMFPGRSQKACTRSGKVDRIGRYVEARFPDAEEIEVWIGFGADESSRIKDGRYKQGGRRSRRTERYPLREVGFCRCREERLARSSGYPVPRKSACVFCGMSSRLDFQTLARELPERFAAAEFLEENFAARGGTAAGRLLTYSGKDDVRLAEYIEKPFDHSRSRERKVCGVCGDLKATKRTACDFLTPGKKCG